MPAANDMFLWPFGALVPFNCRHSLRCKPCPHQKVSQNGHQRVQKVSGMDSLPDFTNLFVSFVFLSTRSSASYFAGLRLAKDLLASLGLYLKLLSYPQQIPPLYL